VTNRQIVLENGQIVLVFIVVITKE